jgi:hypothetical protein
MLVQYRIMVINNNNNNVVNTTNVSSSLTSHNISGLSPFTEYRFQVRAENNAGVGPYSDAVGATTLEDAPTNAPANFRVDIINATEIMVSWQQPPPPVNGMVVLYVLRVNSSEEVRMINSSTTQELITGLTPNTVVLSPHPFPL